MPACLPITTDFLPDKRTLIQDYVTSAYTLLPEEQMDYSRCYRGEEDKKNHDSLSTQQVYNEFICQRLQQGFQIILIPQIMQQNDDDHKEYALSIGRIFHKVTLEGRNITITQFKRK